MIGEAALALPQIPLTQTDPTDPVVIMNMTQRESESANYRRAKLGRIVKRPRGTGTLCGSNGRIAV